MFSLGFAVSLNRRVKINKFLDQFMEEMKICVTSLRVVCSEATALWPPIQVSVLPDPQFRSLMLDLTPRRACSNGQEINRRGTLRNG